MLSQKSATKVFWLIITVIPIIGIVVSFSDPQSFSRAQEVWQGRILVFGVFAPLAFIALQALQVVVTPISHYSVGVVGGFLFGPWLGALLNWIGRIIGHLVAFWLARIIGRKIAGKYVSAETIQKYDRWVSDKSFALFLMYFLPLFPDDEMSYLAGLSKMKFRVFLFANVFGHIGGSVSLAYIGNGLDTKDPILWALMLISLVGFFVLWWLLWSKRKENAE